MKRIFKDIITGHISYSLIFKPKKKRILGVFIIMFFFNAYIEDTLCKFNDVSLSIPLLFSVNFCALCRVAYSDPGILD